MNTGVALHKEAFVTKNLADYENAISKFDEAADLESRRPSQLVITWMDRAHLFHEMYEELLENLAEIDWDSTCTLVY